MIEVSNLTKVYGKTVAVDHLSFSVQPGIVTGFLGPNGAGKSTTMRMILGLDSPTTGSALIGGKPYRALVNPLTQVGALLDANWVHPNRTAYSHLRWMAATNRIPSARIGEVLDLVGLGSVAKKKVGGFSLGMRQRLGLAGALLGQPQVLLFDEPVNGLDPEGIYWMRTLMQQLASQGATVLVSSHLLSEMALTATHLIVIGQGKLIADQPTQDFIDAATRASVRVRSPRIGELTALLQQQVGAIAEPIPGAADAVTISDVTCEQIGEAAAGAGIPLYELTQQHASLEQAFMQMTGQAVEFGAGPVAGPGPVTGLVAGAGPVTAPDAAPPGWPTPAASGPPRDTSYLPPSTTHTQPEGWQR